MPALNCSLYSFLFYSSAILLSIRSRYESFPSLNVTAGCRLESLYMLRRLRSGSQVAWRLRRRRCIVTRTLIRLSCHTTNPLGQALAITLPVVALPIMPKQKHPALLAGCFLL